MNNNIFFNAGNNGIGILQEYYQFNESNNDFVLNKEDTRYKYPYNPPVNPVVSDTILEGKYGYSGGHVEVLKVPLQVTYQNEILRSQNVVITPYNRIKYSINGC